MSLSHSRSVVLLLAILALAGGCADAKNPTAPTYSISGSVSPATAGVPISVVGAVTVTVTTNASGAFVAAGLEPGQYAIRPLEPGFLFEPNERIVTITDADVTLPGFLRQVPEEGLSPEDLLRIDAAPESRLPADSVILPNGQPLESYLRSRGFLDAEGNLLPFESDWSADVQAARPTGPQQRKNDIVSRMLYAARDYSCGRAMPRCTKWDFPADPADPVNRPAQTGLTYVYGGKTVAQRIRGVDGCAMFTYGLDCSGLVSLVATAGGLSAPAHSSTQVDPAAWNIPASWQLEWKLVTDGSIQAGDLLGWPGHVGIAEANGSGSRVNFISATGAPNECAKNVTPPRGPRSLSIAGFGRGNPTRVLRLVTTLSGDFDLYIRCTSQSTDAAVIRFTIDNDQGGPFRATGTGTDYDGSPLSFVLEGTYDQNSNVVDATLSFPDGSRVDRIRVTLLEDDTGYFPLTKVVDNGGCEASARLVRVQAGAPAVNPSRSRDASSPSRSTSRLGGPPPNR